MKIDFAKRRQVMERSMRLGHCICDPRRGCPCDVYRDQGICPCAGERPEPADPSTVRLTQLVRNPGCASKISPADLDRVLSRLPEVRDPAIISGLAAADDAAIYRLTDTLCLVQTVDVFTPCVDDPHLFGRICAANCVSDIYAMGGEPRTALSILAFPSETLDGSIMRLMLTGAMETLGEAGVSLVGGHSIKDDEIKLGFAVTGLIDTDVAASLEQARPGDVLVLTKPLGTGVLAFAQQVGRGDSRGMASAAEAMATLNRPAAEAMKLAGASACTDVTGFGLFGHLLKLARQNELTAEVHGESLPAFDGVMEALRNGVVPGAVERNREFLGTDLELEPGVEETAVWLGCDAQTSGGLLIAIAPEKLQALLQALDTRRVSGRVIGNFREPSTGRIKLSRGGPARGGKKTAGAALQSRTSSGTVEQPAADYGNAVEAGAISDTRNMEQETSQHQAHDANCCADAFKNESSPGTAAEAQRGFGAMMRAAQGAGLLEAKTKELILLSLVIHSRCAPCFDAHYHQARQLGISDTEIEEVAWCAIAMGGAPVRMFYQERMAHVRNLAAPQSRK